jgi:hypothetical protein
MYPDQQHSEQPITALDWYSRCAGNLWTDEVFPLLFAIGSMAGLAFGVIRLLGTANGSEAMATEKSQRGTPQTATAPLQYRASGHGKRDLAYRLRKAWSSKNYDRRKKGQPLIPRPSSSWAEMAEAIARKEEHGFE